MNKKDKAEVRKNYIRFAGKLIRDAKDKKNTSVKLLSHSDGKSRVEKIMDGWKNIMTGLGGRMDKSIYTNFSGYPVLSDRTLSEIWAGDGYGARIISVVADDMTRKWITIEGDSDNIILKVMRHLKTENMMNVALKWKRLFGGSIVVIGINDGGELWEPVNENKIKSVDWLRVFDRTQISLTTMNFVDDTKDPNYGEIDFISVTPVYGSPFNVHISRVLMFKGIPTPHNIAIANFWYWGMSELQPIWTNLKDLGAGINNTSKLLFEFIIGKYKFKNLAKKVAEGKEDEVRKRLSLMDTAKSVLQSIIVDADGEDYTRDSANASGIADILDRFMIFLSGATGIPVTRLFGRSPAGLNSTGESDLMNYYDMIASKQRTELMDQIEKLVFYINNSILVKSKGIKEPMIKFNSLFQLTEKEEITNRKTQADTDKIYLDMGAITSEEIRESRFANGYSYETTLDPDADEEDLEVTPGE